MEKLCMIFKNIKYNDYKESFFIGFQFIFDFFFIIKILGFIYLLINTTIKRNVLNEFMKISFLTG